MINYSLNPKELILKSYFHFQLLYKGITIETVEIQTEKRNVNEFHTKFSQNNVYLSNGIDFGPKTPVYAAITHLNHEHFDYYIKVSMIVTIYIILF